MDPHPGITGMEPFFTSKWADISRVTSGRIHPPGEYPGDLLLPGVSAFSDDMHLQYFSSPIGDLIPVVDPVPDNPGNAFSGNKKRDVRPLE